MAFRFEITPKSRVQLERERSIIAHMFQSPDLELAMTLLGMSRDLRRGYAECGKNGIADGTNQVYDTTLVWSVLPDLAWRLGLRDKRSFLPGERENAGSYILTSNSGNYRRGVWSTLTNSNLVPLTRLLGSAVPTTARLLDRLAVHGNPVEIALERLYPAEEHAIRPLSSHPGQRDPASDMLEISRARRVAPSMSWSPAWESQYVGSSLMA